MRLLLLIGGLLSPFIILFAAGCGKITTPEDMQARAASKVSSFLGQHLPQGKACWDSAVESLESDRVNTNRRRGEHQRSFEIIPQIIDEADRLTGVTARVRVMLTPEEYRSFQMAWAEFQKSIPTIAEANPLAIAVELSASPSYVEMERRNGIWQPTKPTR